jgi:superfamily II DNA helicase RecQ
MDIWIIIIQDYDRPNLFFEVRPKKSKRADQLADILEYIKRHGASQCGIVYCMTKADSEEVSLFLRKNGVSIRV